MGQENSKGASGAPDPFAMFRCAEEESFECCQNRRDETYGCEVRSSAPSKSRVNRVVADATLNPPRTPRMSPNMANTVLIDPTSPSMHQASAFGDIERIQFELDNGWHGEQSPDAERSV
eukprot:754693-Hanusia_phi.AAC.3